MTTPPTAMNPAVGVPLPPETTVAIPPDSYIDWPAVLAGTALALATSALLLMFGASIGLSVTSPWAGEGASVETIGIAAAIWFALVHIYAVGVGGYLAGRMRPRASNLKRDEVSFRDGANGLVVWALAIVIGLFVATSTISSVTRTATGAAASVASAVAPLAQQTVDLTFAQVAQGEQPNAAATPNTAGQQPALTDDERERVVAALQRALVQGEFAARDRAYLEGMMVRKTGVTPEQAKARLDEAVKPAIQSAKETADEVRKATALTGFLSALVMLLSGLAAFWAGSMGGAHRDDVTFERDV